MKVGPDEFIRMTPIKDNGERIVDIRVWKRSPTGGVPTRRSIIIPQSFVVKLIIKLQNLHEFVSAEDAKEMATKTR